jgi:hypothetical protein
VSQTVSEQASAVVAATGSARNTAIELIAIEADNRPESGQEEIDDWNATLNEFLTGDAVVDRDRLKILVGEVAFLAGRTLHEYQALTQA